MGALGGIVQHHTALYRSVAVHEPTVLIVRRGCKKLRWAGHELRIAAGEAVALAGGQTFDVINIPDSDGLYQAQWIAFEQETVERFAAQYGTAQAVCDAVKLPHPGRMNAAFDYAAAVLADEEVPHNAAEAALCGVLAWLQHDGIGFAVYGGGNLMRQIRKLITALTIPAASTDLPIITNTDGSSTPKAANSGHVGKNAPILPISGF
ncbi:hypothetical protein ACRPFF_01495, partial [Neisseria sp. SLRRB23]